MDEVRRQHLFAAARRAVAHAVVTRAALRRARSRQVEARIELEDHAARAQARRRSA